jgi:hypothetical protein
LNPAVDAFQQKKSSSSMSIDAVVGILVGLVLAIVLGTILMLLYKKWLLKKIMARDQLEMEAQAGYDGPRVHGPSIWSICTGSGGKKELARGAEVGGSAR